ncbi:MAG: preprotein translocase subunit SecG [Alphaproteobacteria bacterium]|jgi:preprotein translocase subunit SecG|nr:preprotein translocase subunit SecG [Alphaproteobacteria bacterium]MBP9867712.1 preprotein translocase subunit SecG [Alphaproteobacteria bacterium]
MEHVVLVIHLIVTLVLIVLIMLQRSEGGGLGLGTGGGLGNVASAQSTANVLTKITTFVAIGFFATSLILAIIAARGNAPKSILDSVAETKTPVAVTAPAVPQGDEPKKTETEDAVKAKIEDPKPTTQKEAVPETPKPSPTKPKSEPKVPLAN